MLAEIALQGSPQHRHTPRGAALGRVAGSVLPAPYWELTSWMRLLPRGLQQGMPFHFLKRVPPSYPDQSCSGGLWAKCRRPHGVPLTRALRVCWARSCAGPKLQNVAVRALEIL